jgi:hypothetical protein
MHGQGSGTGGNNFTGGMNYSGFPTVPDFGTVSFAHFNIANTAIMTVDSGGRTFYTYNFTPHAFLVNPISVVPLPGETDEEFELRLAAANEENAEEAQRGMEAAIDVMYQNYIRELVRNGFNSVGTPRADVNIYQRDRVRVTITRSGASVVVMIENT